MQIRRRRAIKSRGATGVWADLSWRICLASRPTSGASDGSGAVNALSERPISATLCSGAHCSQSVDECYSTLASVAPIVLAPKCTDLHTVARGRQPDSCLDKPARRPYRRAASISRSISRLCARFMAYSPADRHSLSHHSDRNLRETHLPIDSRPPAPFPISHR